MDTAALMFFTIGATLIALIITGISRLLVSRAQASNRETQEALAMANEQLEVLSRRHMELMQLQERMSELARFRGSLGDEQLARQAPINPTVAPPADLDLTCRNCGHTAGLHFRASSPHCAHEGCDCTRYTHRGEDMSDINNLLRQIRQAAPSNTQPSEDEPVRRIRGPLPGRQGSMEISEDVIDEQIEQELAAVEQEPSVPPEVPVTRRFHDPVFIGRSSHINEDGSVSTFNSRTGQLISHVEADEETHVVTTSPLQEMIAAGDQLDLQAIRNSLPPALDGTGDADRYVVEVERAPGAPVEAGPMGQGIRGVAVMGAYELESTEFVATSFQVPQVEHMVRSLDMDRVIAPLFPNGEEVHPPLETIRGIVEAQLREALQPLVGQPITPELSQRVSQITEETYLAVTRQLREARYRLPGERLARGVQTLQQLNDAIAQDYVLPYRVRAPQAAPALGEASGEAAHTLAASAMPDHSLAVDNPAPRYSEPVSHVTQPADRVAAVAAQAHRERSEQNAAFWAQFTANIPDAPMPPPPTPGSLSGPLQEAFAARQAPTEAPHNEFPETRIDSAAAAAINDFTRTHMREDGFFQRTLPPLQINNDELDRSVDTDRPVRVVDDAVAREGAAGAIGFQSFEQPGAAIGHVSGLARIDFGDGPSVPSLGTPVDPAAISIPFDTLPTSPSISGPRYRVRFDRITIPRFRVPYEDFLKLGLPVGYLVDYDSLPTDPEGYHRRLMLNRLKRFRASPHADTTLRQADVDVSLPAIIRRLVAQHMATGLTRAQAQERARQEAQGEYDRLTATLRQRRQDLLDRGMSQLCESMGVPPEVLAGEANALSTAAAGANMDVFTRQIRDAMQRRRTQPQDIPAQLPGTLDIATDVGHIRNMLQRTAEHLGVSIPSEIGEAGTVSDPAPDPMSELVSELSQVGIAPEELIAAVDDAGAVGRTREAIQEALAVMSREPVQMLRPHSAESLQPLLNRFDMEAIRVWGEEPQQMMGSQLMVSGQITPSDPPPEVGQIINFNGQEAAVTNVDLNTGRMTVRLTGAHVLAQEVRRQLEDQRYHMQQQAALQEELEEARLRQELTAAFERGDLPAADRAGARLYTLLHREGQAEAPPVDWQTIRGEDLLPFDPVLQTDTFLYRALPVFLRDNNHEQVERITAELERRGIDPNAGVRSA